jgi:hypothetical protein
MTDKIIPMYDRSRVVQDWKCPRSRYWQYEWMGRGIVSQNTSLELFMGIILHDSLATIAILTKEEKPVNISLIATTAFRQMFEVLNTDPLNEQSVTFALEQATLVEGLLRGFYKHAWPRLLRQFPKILYTEAEMVYEHNGLRFMSKPDLVLANDEEICYIEYKSTSSKKDAWVNSWSTAVQLHSTIKAIKATHDIDVDSVIVQGLYKGVESYGKQSSPFCYAYSKKGNPPFTKDELAYDYRAGFKRTPTWELKGGVEGWVEGMPEEVLGDQFPQTPPIYIKKDIVEEFFAQRTIREHEIFNATEQLLQIENNIVAGADPDDSEPTKIHLLNSVFPQRFDQCIPSFGRPCSYLKLCHGPKVNPLDAGYVMRDPHHDPEKVVLIHRQVLES